MSGGFPGISIVITSYNYGRFIGRALASARAQDAPDLEIVVVDNASTDGSWEIIEAAATQDSRIRAFRNEINIGMVANHSRGLELATKPRVLFLSADDYLLPGHIARLVGAQIEHPGVDYIFTAYVHVNEHDELIRYLGHVGHPRGSYFGGRNEFADLLTYDCYACTATTLFHRDDMLQSGIDHAIIAGDYDQYLRLAAAGARFGFIDQAGVALRIHAAEFTGEARYMATGKQLLDQLSILEKHLTQSNGQLIAGREQGIANLLLAKVANLNKFPDVVAGVLVEAQPRVDAVMAYLNDSRQRYLAKPLGDAPLASVVLVCDDDLGATLRCLRSLAAQTYTNWELVLVTNATLDATPLLLDRARGLNVRIVHHGAPHGRGVSLNDGLTLVSGEIVAYADAHGEWQPSHLERLVSHYRTSSIDALIVSSDYLPREGARAPGFFGSAIAQATIGVGEGVPLGTFSHRRGLIDRFGRFDEGLGDLADFEFIARIFSHVNTGLDTQSTVTIHERGERLPLLSDRSGYLSTLRAIYDRSAGGPELTRRREEHLRRVTEALAVASDQGRDDSTRFASVIRGLGES